MGSCTNTRNFDTGQNRRHKPSTPPQHRPQIDMKRPTDTNALYRIYIETLRVKRLYHLIAHFEICRGRSTAPPQHTDQTNRTLHINHLIRSTVERYVPAMPRHPGDATACTSPFERHRKQKLGTQSAVDTAMATLGQSVFHSIGHPV